VRVLADPERIAQVLRNLLSNAAKFSPAGAPIDLRSTIDGKRVLVEVTDRGVGVHPDDVSRIFEKLGRGRDQGGAPVPGVGLGLYVSRQLVRAHGSDLTFCSRPGGGAVFGFELELA
jgi:signal transduction histidine kinase